MFKALEVDSEGAVELSDRAGEDYTAPCRALLHDRKAMRTRELLYLLDILRVGPELLRELLALEVIGPAFTPDHVAEAAGTNGYEVLTSLGHRFHRVYRAA